MISYEKAKKTLRKYIKGPKVIKHSKGVSDFAFKLAKKINEKHPELKIDVEKVRIAALLHDIGKYHEEGHEERSLNILKKEGLKEIEKISKHAFLFLKHVEEKGISNSTEEIENKIVAYSDARFKFSPMTVEERVEQAKTGWKGSPKEINSKVKYVKSLLSKLEKELLELAGEKV